MTPYKLALSALVALASLLAPSPTQGQNHQLVFTEESPSLLTATLDGSPFGTILNTAADHWTWNTAYGPAPLPVTGLFINLDGGHLAWDEPGTESGQNYVATISIVFDDTRTTMAWTLVSDGSTTAPSVSDGTLGGTFSFGATGFTGLGPTDVYFFDHGDTRSVPDDGTTLGMLFTAVLGMFGTASLRQSRAPKKIAPC